MILTLNSEIFSDFQKDILSVDRIIYIVKALLPK